MKVITAAMVSNSIHRMFQLISGTNVSDGSRSLETIFEARNSKIREKENISLLKHYLWYLWITQSVNKSKMIMGHKPLNTITVKRIWFYHMQRWWNDRIRELKLIKRFVWDQFCEPSNFSSSASQILWVKVHLVFIF